ncbi:MAG: dihydroneopterin aldolase [Lentimicrobiaceae bacterium]|nr:dihydroneopterin aldolase [Lentimicrobiaceae bacterium]MBQ2906332.1 dihydroneopterin aldolase [Bacteroidales bacterium]
MMSKITIENMEFYAYHGHFEEEQKIGTWFSLDLIMNVDTSKAEFSDELEDTVDYSAVYQVVKEQMMIPSKLLENVGRRILDTIKVRFPDVNDALLKVRKMNPPLGGKMDFVALELKM